jgi:hypothetical protein
MSQYALVDFEIEEHLAETNRFFQLTGLTADDLHIYGAPLAAVVNAVRRYAESRAKLQEALDTVPVAAGDLKAIDAEIEARDTAHAA